MGMTAEVTISEGARLEPHALRAAILGEVHARPFTPIETPRRLLHFAFDTAGEAGKRDRAALAEFCAKRGLAPLKEGAKHHRVELSGVTLRWEQHSEFTTYSWELAVAKRAAVPSGGLRRWPRPWQSCRSRARCWWRSTCI